MRRASRLAIILFAVLYIVSIAVTFLKVERHLASGGRPFHLAGPQGGHYLFRRREAVRGGVPDDNAAGARVLPRFDEPSDTAAAVAANARPHPLAPQKIDVSASSAAAAAPSDGVLIRRPGFPTDQQGQQGPGRFPRRGTPEFLDRCGWTLKPPDPISGGNCTILVRPEEGGNEGVSWWSMQVVNGYLHARQSGCGLLIDYGGDVDVRGVMEPLLTGGATATGTGAEEGLYDWTVPPGFVCAEQERCFHTGAHPTFDSSVIDNRTIVASPNYRFAFGKCRTCRYRLYPSSADNIRAALPGFNLESGVACAYANLFRGLANPGAEEYEPRLFAELLPAVRDPTSLVISIYIRSDWADTVATHEEKLKKGEIDSTAKEPAETDRRDAMINMMRCAMNVEDQFKAKVTSGDGGMTPYSKVVWMILTDSPSIKKWAYEPIQWNDTKTGKDKSRYAAANRTVLVTSSRGVHTRTRRNPSTADFAEAAVDWWLIGESDAVVLNKWTFGYTASLRTSRPVYSLSSRCRKPERLVYDEPTKRLR